MQRKTWTALPEGFKDVPRNLGVRSWDLGESAPAGPFIDEERGRLVSTSSRKENEDLGLH